MKSRPSSNFGMRPQREIDFLTQQEKTSAYPEQDTLGGGVGSHLQCNNCCVYAVAVRPKGGIARPQDSCGTPYSYIAVNPGGVSGTTPSQQLVLTFRVPCVQANSNHCVTLRCCLSIPQRSKLSLSCMLCDNIVRTSIAL